MNIVAAFVLILAAAALFAYGKANYKTLDPAVAKRIEYHENEHAQQMRDESVNNGQTRALFNGAAAGAFILALVLVLV